MKIILASKSPRRRELLDLIHIPYEIIVSEVEEILNPELTIEEQAKQLSYQKAKAVFDKTKGDRAVIGSDTMVIKDKKIYGKPKDEEEAIQMIQELENGTHQVITGLSILIEKEGKYQEEIDYDITEVTINKMTNQEILDWIKSGNAYDKAGAYAIQGEFSKHIEKINGNYATVVGLPIHKVYKILKNNNLLK